MTDDLEIVFYTTDQNDQRWRVIVTVHPNAIARVLGAKAMRNRTHRSKLAGFAKASAKQE